MKAELPPARRGAKRVSIEYARKDSGAIACVCIALKSDKFIAYHGTDPAMELLEGAADMAEAIERFHGEYGSLGKQIHYLFRQPAETKED
jgi:hypothetical protein